LCFKMPVFSLSTPSEINNRYALTVSAYFLASAQIV